MGFVFESQVQLYDRLLPYLYYVLNLKLTDQWEKREEDDRISSTVVMLNRSYYPAYRIIPFLVFKHEKKRRKSVVHLERKFLWKWGSCPTHAPPSISVSGLWWFFPQWLLWLSLELQRGAPWLFNSLLTPRKLAHMYLGVAMEWASESENCIMKFQCGE